MVVSDRQSIYLLRGQGGISQCLEEQVNLSAQESWAG